MKMTNNLVPISDWHFMPGTQLDIDWPRMNRELGVACVDWLMEQSSAGKLTLHVEIPEDNSGPPVQRLSAEFHDPEAQVEYALRF